MGATQPRLARGVLGCVLVLASAGCSAAPRAADRPAVSSAPSAPATPSPPAPSRATVSTEDNVRATRAFSAWLLHAVPMPPGAQEWHRSPSAHFRRGSVGIGPSDRRFTRTTWWTVPLPAASFRAWLRSHAPRGLRAESDSGGSVESTGVWEEDQAFHAPSTSAHTRGWVNVAFMPDGDRLVARVDTFVGARFARTVWVPEDAVSVTLRRTVRSTGPRPRPHVSVRTVTGRDAVARLVHLVNDLPGAMTAPFVASCPVRMTDTSYTLVFATSEGTYVASLASSGCWPQVRLLRDGVVVGPPLEPGSLFTRTVDAHLP